MRILSRLGTMAALLAALLVASFLLLHLVPGDPAVRIAGLNATPEQVAAVRHRLGLDLPLHRQFAEYVMDGLRLDFGRSFRTGEPVTGVIGGSLGVTLRLAAMGITLTMLTGVALGIAMAALTREGRRPGVETAFTTGTSLVGAVPEYVTGAVLALVFAVGLGWLPVAGLADPAGLVLPAVAVSLAPVCVLARVIRVETLAVLAHDYVRTARAKRLHPVIVYGRHVLPNALTSALTVGGLIFAGLLGGAVVIENVFALPGLGSQLVQSVMARDYPVVQVVIMLLGASIVVVNSCVDGALRLLDPRTRTVSS
ncbi:ABC transporter permease [Spongiactinospora gelatinilytica]|uniref:ABC transporter permease n=1 Tax=Spongiactinospora gelatinilytica TaxID=2666298 RepID=A0A2W2G0B7_9ACTN|nr:ABC transporter permease [Spongiactinospora gelatinilytica]PZG41511.1 ABC transporter permease [Spongiactinospora gelatinilytica]